MQMSLDTEEANMVARAHRRLEGRHWVLIAAAAVVIVILFARSIADPTDWRSDVVAGTAIAVAVTSMLGLRREKTG
jgi:hypothetical protein